MATPVPSDPGEELPNVILDLSALPGPMAEAADRLDARSAGALETELQAGLVNAAAAERTPGEVVDMLAFLERSVEDARRAAAAQADPQG